jgi:indole-3-glycerol phosphate synthase
MSDFLDILAQNVLETINSGYYKEVQKTIKYHSKSLVNAIMQAKGNAIIAEVKAASPSEGYLRKKIDPVKLSVSMIKAGASGISVLTEPNYFKGSISNIIKINTAHNTPILMKDFILSDLQLETARKIGASAVLLISTLFSRGYCKKELTEMIDLAHKQNLEVLLETHSRKEFINGVSTDADLIGINNRDLKTLKTDLRVTERILKTTSKSNKIIVSESGVKSPEDVRYLRECGADAFLVGSSIMASKNPENKVRELVEA